MKIAIMQPTYFPWIGYFSLIKFVDTFIFLDNVQFDSRSWQQRNQIASGNKKIWITIPVKKKNLSKQSIKEVEIQDNKFKDKHLKSIHHSYSKTMYFKSIYPKIVNMLKNDTKSLSEINKFIIMEISKLLEIKTKFLSAKNLKSKGKKSELLSNICREIGADEYIAVLGSKEYMGDQIEFKKKNIKVNFFNFEQKKYKRGNYNFIPNLSILDLLFYNGPNTNKLIINEK